MTLFSRLLLGVLPHMVGQNAHMWAFCPKEGTNSMSTLVVNRLVISNARQYTYALMIIKHNGKLYSSQFTYHRPNCSLDRWKSIHHPCSPDEPIAYSPDTVSIFLLVYYMSLHILDKGRNHHPHWKNRSQTCADVCISFLQAIFLLFSYCLLNLSFFFCHSSLSTLPLSSAFLHHLLPSSWLSAWMAMMWRRQQTLPFGSWLDCLAS